MLVAVSKNTTALATHHGMLCVSVLWFAAYLLGFYAESRLPAGFAQTNTDTPAFLHMLGPAACTLHFPLYLVADAVSFVCASLFASFAVGFIALVIVTMEDYSKFILLTQGGKRVDLTKLISNKSIWKLTLLNILPLVVATIGILAHSLMLICSVLFKQHTVMSEVFLRIVQSQLYLAHLKSTSLRLIITFIIITFATRFSALFLDRIRLSIIVPSLQVESKEELFTKLDKENSTIYKNSKNNETLVHDKSINDDALAKKQK